MLGDAEETGCRGRELRRGGDCFGGAAEMYAFKLDGFVFSFSGTLDLRAPWRGGVAAVLLLAAVRVLGVVERPVEAVFQEV